MVRLLTTLSLTVMTAGTATADAPAAGGDDGAAVSFVACPVYRDTDAGPKSGCWLATDRATGRRYDVSGALTKPMVGREILVEGVPGDASEACGGTRLDPSYVSVLASSCPEYLIPAEGYPGARFELPAEVMQPTDVPRTLPEPPYEARRFSIWFDFGSDFLRYQYSELILEKASLYARASGGDVTIVGHADAEGYRIPGRRLAEEPALARRRAQVVAEALGRLEVSPDHLEVRWQVNPEPTEGPARASLRRVEIAIEP